jgi:hypothetical protein
MNPIFAIPLFVTILSLSSTAESQRAPDVEAACYANAGHADARDCLAARAAEAGSRLKNAEYTFKDGLAKSSADPAEITRAVTAFNLASQQYQRYRKDQCDFVATLAFGGNGGSDRRLLCQIELDNRRLTDLASERPRGV